MLDVRKLSRLFTEDGGKTRPAETDQHLLYTAGSRLWGRNRIKSKKIISRWLLGRLLVVIDCEIKKKKMAH